MYRVSIIGYEKEVRILARFDSLGEAVGYVRRLTAIDEKNKKEVLYRVYEGQRLVFSNDGQY